MFVEILLNLAASQRLILVKSKAPFHQRGYFPREQMRRIWLSCAITSIFRSLWEHTDFHLLTISMWSPRHTGALYGMQPTLKSA